VHQKFVAAVSSKGCMYQVEQGAWHYVWDNWVLHKSVAVISSKGCMDQVEQGAWHYVWDN
jgi:hypothetical protein